MLVSQAGKADEPIQEAPVSDVTHWRSGNCSSEPFSEKSVLRRK
jgi:hypothetical protein